MENYEKMNISLSYENCQEVKKDLETVFSLLQKIRKSFDGSVPFDDFYVGILNLFARELLSMYKHIESKEKTYIDEN